MFERLDFRFVETSSDWETVAKVRTANHCARNVGRQKAHRMPLRSDCCSMPKKQHLLWYSHFCCHDTLAFPLHVIRPLHAMTRATFRCRLSVAWKFQVQSCVHLIPVCLFVRPCEYHRGQNFIIPGGHHPSWTYSVRFCIVLYRSLLCIGLFIHPPTRTVVKEGLIQYKTFELQTVASWRRNLKENGSREPCFTNCMTSSVLKIDLIQAVVRVLFETTDTNNSLFSWFI